MTAQFTDYSTSPVAGQEVDKKDSDKHIIVTNHPVLVDIGLGTFTTGTLMAWWNEPSDESPDLLNRLFFPGEDGNDYPSFLFDGNLNFSAWRNPDRDYVNYTDAAKTWNFSNIESDGSTRNHTFSDLNFSDFDDAEVERQTDDASAPRVVSLASEQNIDQKICNIISMNDYINMFHDFDPDETQSSWTGTPRARSEYIRDIKTCKNGSGLFWTPTINYSPSNGVDTTDTIEITPTFHLYLFDEIKPSKNMRKLAMRDFVIIDNPKDAIDTVYENRTKIDGTYNQVDPGNTPQARVAAPLDVTYNQYTGKWESGTRQIIARLMTDIPAAQNISLTAPDAGTQYGLEVSDILNKDNPNYEHAQIGKAMPIMMQNGNPLQWSPMYEQAEDLPRVNTNKKLVDVVNPAGRAWTSGTMVILNKIDGVWIPSDFGVQEGAAAATSNFDGVWDFTYLLSNARYHMSKDATGESFHYDDYERLYYKSYYGTVGDNSQENVSDFTVLASSEEGYLQITSWDFMGPNLGGNSPKNNIGATVFDINVNGEPIGENADGKRARTKASAPFFGCTFPGGYVGDSIYSAYNTAGHAALSTTLGAYSAAPFFKPVAESVIVFDNTMNNNNSNSYAGNNMGMFARNSSSLVHFPADMAVNASPSGENGRPISDIRRIYEFIKPDGSALTNAFTYFDKDNDDSDKPLRYAWMYKDSNPWDSAWDLSPKNKNIIEFRPLTRDVFNCLEVQNLTEYNALANPGFGERGLYGRKAQEVLIQKGDPPMSPVILNRTTDRSITQLSRDVIPNAYPQPHDGSTNKTRLAYGPQDMEGGGYYTENQRYKPAPYPIDGYGTTNKPGGAAIGIITAICTTTAPSKIVFNTQTYIGVQTISPNDDPAHGGSQRPQDFGCTALHARIFSAWPRELTVYDSRFFSVFHFNYGAGVTDFGSDWYLDGVKQNGTPPPNASYSYPDGWYKVSRKITEVDIRVPTWRTPTTETVPDAGVNDNNEIPDDQLMFNNSAVRSVDDWLIPEDNTTGGIRRGKLLPLSSADKYKGFKYKKKTIKPGGAGVTITSYPVPTTPPATPVTNDGTKHVMIINGGSGYTLNDRFTIRGATGTGTVLIPEIPDPTTGQITGFTFATVTDAEAYNSGDTLTGYDYLHTDFLDYNAPLDGSVKPSAQIIATDAAGQDLEAYFVCGVVGDSPLLRDLGPDEVTEGAERLTPSPSSSDNFVTQPILDDLTETSIGTEGKSSDNKFDIYFFFHNDVTHHSYDDSLYHQFFQSRVRVEILQE